MKYLLTTLPDENAASTPPTPEFMAEIQKFIEAERRAGVLLETGGLLPVSMGGANVRSEGGRFIVTDGPFIEAKELIAGFAIIEVNSKEEAIEASRRFFVIAGDGRGEIRQIVD